MLEAPRPLHIPEGKTYSASPLEAAFDAFIGENYGISLGDPEVIEDNHEFRRVSPPVQVKNVTAVFQYTRKDPMSVSNSAVVDAYKLANPSDNWLPPYAQLDDRMTINAEVNATWVDIQQAKMEAAEGNPHWLDEMLTDPEYYVPGVPLTQYAEMFEFALFTGTTKPDPTDDARPIEDGAVDGIKADFYGTLVINPRFKGVQPSMFDMDEFYITNPAFEAATDLAVYTMLRREEAEPNENEVFHLALHFYNVGEAKGFQGRMVIEETPPVDFMKGFGNYIDALTGRKKP